MRTATLHASLKLVGIVVLAAMAGAILYAGYISFTHWHGIGV